MKLDVSSGETGTRAVRRAAEVLRLLGGQAAGCTLSEITRGLGLSKATVHRLLQTLVNERLVDISRPTGRYAIGAEFIGIAMTARRSGRLAALHTIEALSAQAMTRLRDRTGETVALVIRRGDERINVVVALGTHELIAVPKAGGVLPIFLGGPGKLLMAFMPEAEVDAIAARLKASEPAKWPFRHFEAMRAELRTIRELGFATSLGEAVDGQASTAVPIRQGAVVIAALNLIVPTVRYTDERQASFLELARAAAAEISGAIEGAFDHEALWE